MFSPAHPIFNRPEGALAGFLTVLKSVGVGGLGNKRVLLAVRSLGWGRVSSLRLGTGEPPPGRFLETHFLSGGENGGFCADSA